MTLRRLVVLALVVPYALVMWPRWAARDFAAAYRYRKARAERRRQ